MWRGVGRWVGQQKQKNIEDNMAIQSKHLSKKQSIGEAKAIASQEHPQTTEPRWEAGFR